MIPDNLGCTPWSTKGVEMANLRRRSAPSRRKRPAVSPTWEKTACQTDFTTVPTSRQLVGELKNDLFPTDTNYPSSFENSVFCGRSFPVSPASWEASRARTTLARTAMAWPMNRRTLTTMKKRCEPRRCASAGAACAAASSLLKWRCRAGAEGQITRLERSGFIDRQRRDESEKETLARFWPRICWAIVGQTRFVRTAEKQESRKPLWLRLFR